MEPRKQAIIDALTRFMNQRSGLEFGNYGDVKAFRAEQRSITKDLHHARELMRAVAWRDAIDADVLIKAAASAYSGRLTIVPPLQSYKRSPCSDSSSPAWRIEYVTGQYFPTEYRRAVCAVLASVLWYYTREKAMPKPGTRPIGLRDAGDGAGKYWDGKRWLSAGDWLRAHFRKEFGRGIASRWFS
jgi:hypothetical protein